MGSKPKSIVDELKAVKFVRPHKPKWEELQSAANKQQLAEFQKAYVRGDYVGRASDKQLHAWVCDRLKIEVSFSAFYDWLKRR